MEHLIRTVRHPVEILQLIGLNIRSKDDSLSRNKISANHQGSMNEYHILERPPRSQTVRGVIQDSVER